MSFRYRLLGTIFLCAIAGPASSQGVPSAQAPVAGTPQGPASPPQVLAPSLTPASGPASRIAVAASQVVPVREVRPPLLMSPPNFPASASPGTLLTPQPAKAVAPVVPTKVKGPSAAQLEAHRQQEEEALLARLDKDLSQASQRLDRAGNRLDQGQKQLASVSGVLQQAMLELGNDARGLNPFVKVAQRYLGTPYVWGGVSGRGFDCSGFIIRVMRDLGYRALPHSAADQFRYGIPIPNPLLKPGDLVFFANTYKPGVSHVGIYLGRRKFIHAANSNDGTIVSSLDEAKWKQKYAGARRLVKVKA